MNYTEEIVNSIHHAAKEKDDNLLQGILKKSPALDIAFNDETAISRSAKENDWPTVSFLLSHGASKDWAVRGAAQGGHESLMKKLLRLGASKDWAVRGAAQGGYETLVDELLKQKAKKNWAIQGAAQGNHENLVDELLQQGASRKLAIRGAVRGNNEVLIDKLLQQNKVHESWALNNAPNELKKKVYHLIQWRVRHTKDNFLFQLPFETRQLWTESRDLRVFVLIILGQKFFSTKPITEQNSITFFPVEILFEISKHLLSKKTEMNLIQFKTLCSTMCPTVLYFKPLEAKLEKMKNSAGANNLLQELRNHSHEPRELLNIINQFKAVVADKPAESKKVFSKVITFFQRESNLQQLLTKEENRLLPKQVTDFKTSS